MKVAIGVIGGVGPYAGIDIAKKIFDHTNATKDQDHIDLYLTNLPSAIGDRTEFLLHGGENPAIGLFRSLEKLVTMGATTIVIPCNTAHAPAIYQEVQAKTSEVFPHITLLNMIEETCKVIDQQYSEGATIGLLATRGTHTVQLYQQYLASYRHLHLIEPSKEAQRRVHDAIYHADYGIKAVSPVTEKAKHILTKEAISLIDRGASLIILGCTELPLALHEGDLPCTLIDPTSILARAAIRSVAPEKLRFW